MGVFCLILHAHLHIFPQFNSANSFFLYEFKKHLAVMDNVDLM